ncbi:hypothetical protein ACFL4Y_02810, partial [Gemmatimonadota bacterium]
MGKTLYQQASYPSRLHSAWAVIRHNGSVSSSPGTRRAIEQYSKSARQNIDSIYRGLLHREYTFQPATGIALTREGKDPRPLVVAEIPDRIVQRSLLDRIQGIPAVRKAIAHEGSYGAIQKRGVRDAITKAITTQSGGGNHYLRSDIKGFFNRIPRLDALSQLAKVLPDSSLNDILEAAT